MTLELLQKCLPYARPENIKKFGPKLIEAMEKYGIDSPKRQAAFLAQIAHESGSLYYVEEIATGEAYEGRKDLGNTEPGDGKRFKGRGLVQITGRANYTKLGEVLGYDFISDPEALEWPGPASFSAAWFWHSRKLNELADLDDFEKISTRINGTNKKTGRANGIEDRLRHWEKAKKALGIDDAIENQNT